MSKELENKVIEEEKAKIRKRVLNKYRRIAQEEVKNHKIFLDKTPELKAHIQELQNKLLQEYQDFIEQEVEEKVKQFKKSKRFKDQLRKKIRSTLKIPTLKQIKKCQKLPIRIPKEFILLLQKEINKDCSEKDFIEIQEIEYITMNVLFAIIKRMTDGFKVKIGTICKLWVEKRDIVVNFPDVKERIQEDRLIPKMELCKIFDHQFFKRLNAKNEAIINYYKQKTERMLMLLKIKTRNKGLSNNGND